MQASQNLASASFPIRKLLWKINISILANWELFLETKVFTKKYLISYRFKGKENQKWISNGTYLLYKIDTKPSIKIDSFQLKVNAWKNIFLKFSINPFWPINFKITGWMGYGFNQNYSRFFQKKYKELLLKISTDPSTKITKYLGLSWVFFGSKMGQTGQKSRPMGQKTRNWKCNIWRVRIFTS